MQIQSLRDLARIVTRSIIKQPELPNLSKPRGKVDQLIAYLQPGSEMKNVEEWLEQMGENRMLRSRAKRRLLNAILFLTLDPKKSSEYTRAQIENQRCLFWVKILLTMGGRMPAERLARISLAQAEKFSFTSNSLEFANVLRYNALLHGDRPKYHEMSLKVFMLLRTYEAEVRAEHERDRIAMEFMRSTAVRPGLLLKVNKARVVVEELMAGAPSRSLVLSHFYILVMAYQISQEYHKAIKLCDKLQQYFLERPHLISPSLSQSLQIHKLESLIYLKEFDQANQAVTEFDHHVSKGQNNWFIQREMRFILATQSLNFTDAEGVLMEVVSQNRFILQPVVRQEKWEVYQLYLDYALQKPFSKWQISFDTISERVPIYRKDKKGLNVAILIIHILLLVRAGRLDEIVLRMEALQTYRYRYLQGSTNRQSAIFFKMLKVLERESFDKQRVMMKSEKLLEELQSSTASYMEMSQSLQILPYEWLWQRVLEDLDKIRKNS